MSYTLSKFYRNTKDMFSLEFVTSKTSLERTIQWIYMLEDMNNISFIRQGDFIITTGFKANNTKDLLLMLQKIHAQGACGIIVNTGMYIKKIDSKIIDWCNQNDFPLITMPWEIHVSDVTQTVCNAILDENRTRQQLNEALYHILVQELSSDDSLHFQPAYPCWLLASKDALSIASYADTIYKHTHYYLCHQIPDGLNSHIGISNSILSKAQIGVAEQQALRALKVSLIKNQPQMKYSEIGLYNAVLSVNDPEVIKEAQALLAPLSNPDLYQTLRIYLMKQGSVQAVAEELYLHRNTVNHRIAQIKNIIDIDSPEKRLEYLFAFYLLDTVNL